MGSLMKQWSLKSQCVFRRKHTMSNVFRPAQAIPHEKDKVASEKSKSQRLMITNGLIRAISSGGAYHLLPIALKSLEKLVKIIDNVLSEYSCQKIQMPTLTPARFWEMSERLEDCGSEILMLHDRHDKKLILSPTHEEAICDLLRGYPWSHKNLPLRLYQITNKFRDEMKPRFGLLRAREFLMKDLYTFDVDEAASFKTYQEINEAYGKIFDHIGVNYMKVEGTSGVMGGNVSHEYHLISDVGEDYIISCTSCGASFNRQLLGNSPETEAEEQIHSCNKCNSTAVKQQIGIEVGHTFLLGKKYSETFKTTYKNSHGKPVIMDMGCYGIGVTRLLAGVLEVLSSDEHIRWPISIAPYIFAVIPPKVGSKEEAHDGGKLMENVCSYLNEAFPHDFIVDDRSDMTIGKRLLDIKKIGIPHVIIMGKGIMESVPLVEIYNVNTENSTKMTLPQVQSYVTAIKSDHKGESQNQNTTRHTSSA